MNDFQRAFPVLDQRSQTDCDALTTIMPIKEGLDSLVERLTGNLSEYFLKVVAMQGAYPSNPVIFAPHIEINVNSHNTIDARQKNCGNTNVDARKNNCDNSLLRDSFNNLEANSFYQKLISIQQDCSNVNTGSEGIMRKKSLLKFRE